MARGNDPDAGRELAERYGTSGNAAELIDANRARRDRLVQAASRLPIDQEATDELDLESLDVPGTVQDAAVRGNYVSIVYEDASGRSQRTAIVRSDLGKKQTQAAEEAAGADDVETAVAKANAERDAELARIQAEHEKEMAEAIEKARADATKKAQKAAQKVDEDQAKAARDAAKDDKPGKGK